GRIAGDDIGGAAGLGDGAVVGDAGVDRNAGVVVGAGDGDVDVMVGGAVKRGHDQVVVDDGAGGQRIRERLVERVGPRSRARVERVGAVRAGERAGRLEMVLAAVDVADEELAGRGRIAGDDIGGAAGLGDGAVVGDAGVDR